MREVPLRERLWHLLTMPTRAIPASLLALVARSIPPPLRVASSNHFVVIRHPFGSYSTHLVAVARRPTPDMLAGPSVEELTDLAALAKRLATRFEIACPSLVSNIGSFQSVRQLHFHLVPGDEFQPLEQRALAFGASSLDSDPASVAALAVLALDQALASLSSARAARLFLVGVASEAGSRPVVAVEIGGARHA